jgi:hypothetical protein
VGGNCGCGVSCAATDGRADGAVCAESETRANWVRRLFLGCTVVQLGAEPLRETYELWLKDVQAALQSINMPFDDWQKVWRFDFENQFNAGVKANDAAMKANRFWWHEQNKSLKQDCRKTPDCWLPRGHQGECQPIR